MDDYNCQLTESCIKFAEDDIGETSERRTEALIMLKSWLKENPKINANPDPLSLLYFLRACKYDLDRTKENIKKFYKMRSIRSEWFNDRSPLDPHIAELFRIGVFLPLLKKDVDNRQIVIIRTGAHNPKKHKFSDVLKASKMILDYLMFQDESISVYGINAYFDMSHLTGGHAFQLTPTLIKHAVQSWEVYPIRVKLLKFLMVPSHVIWALQIFRSFMSAKLKSRMFISRDTAEDPSRLPVDLGGTESSYDELTVYWREKMESNADFFNRFDKYKTVS
uniref:CSON011904 protein n=1 Tax=Culicoides sonorensis TaxID=179676 RepID=A0A336N1X3_CULSO